MAMGIVKDEDFFKEVTASNKHQRDESTDSKTDVRGIVQDVTRGRPTGSVEVPNGLRKLIGDESVTNGRQSALELGKAFGVSPSSVSAYANGATSTASYNDTPNAPTIKSAKERIAGKARGKLLAAIRNITEDKLADSKARDLSGIAKDMSAVIKNMEPDTPGKTGEGQGPTFIFYSPQTRREETFDVIEVKE